MSAADEIDRILEAAAKRDQAKGSQPRKRFDYVDPSVSREPFLPGHRIRAINHLFDAEGHVVMSPGETGTVHEVEVQESTRVLTVDPFWGPELIKIVWPCMIELIGMDETFFTEAEHVHTE